MKTYIPLNEKQKRIGQHHPWARYTDSEVAQVLELARQGLSRTEIARKMEMKQRTVDSYLYGQRRNHRASRWMIRRTRG